MSDVYDGIIKNIEKVIRKGVPYVTSNHNNLILASYCKECEKPIGSYYAEKYERQCFGVTEELSYDNSYCKECAEALRDKPLIDEGFQSWTRRVYLIETVYKYNGLSIKRYSDGSEIEELSPDEMRELRWPVMKGKNI